MKLLPLGFGVLAAALLAGACSSNHSSSSTSSADGGGGQGGGNGGGTSSSSTMSTTGTSSTTGTGGAMGGRGFPTGFPWVSFYGPGDMLDLAKVASTFRVINIDADPDGGNFTAAQITTLKAGGQNRVISYLNVGSCEDFRSYWDTDPPGHKSCMSSGALTAPYDGYPDEMWADLSNTAYRDLIVNYVLPAVR